jgi:hypothetical protein
MHIYFNEKELNFKLLNEKPGKKGYKLHHVPKIIPDGNGIKNLRQTGNETIC